MPLLWRNHGRKTRPIHISVKKPHFSTLLHHREGQIDGHRALAHTPFATTDSNDILNRLEPWNSGLRLLGALLSRSHLNFDLLGPHYVVGQLLLDQSLGFAVIFCQV